MQITIKKYKLNKNKNIFVVRDDLLPFGTKQRAGIEYLKNIPQKEIIYVSPPNGMGQLALAQCGLKADKEVIIFTPLRKPKHKLTREVEKIGNTKVFIKHVRKFSELYEPAEKYEAEKPQERKLMPLGFFDDDFINIMASNIKQHWNTEYKPKRMWIVGGSGTLLNALYKVFPDTYFFVVQVGHKIEKNKINEKTTQIIIPPQKFEEEVRNLPPYPSSRTYNAKLWQFRKDFKNNDFVWNVAGEIRDFPYLRDIITQGEVEEMFKKLQKYNYNTRIKHEKYELRNIKNIDLKYQGKPFLLINKNTDYDDFTEISSYFTEACRMKCAVFGHPSPETYFYNNKDKVYEYAFEKFGEVNIYTLRESLYHLNKQCTSFRPNIIMAMIQKYKAKCVLDFSSGWGDRLIGAIACGVNYVGIDPNQCLVKGYHKIIEMLGDSDFNKYYMIKGCAEKVEIPNKKYDLIFTSPPYFDLEIYANNNNQSTKHKGETGWYNNFLLPVLEKVWGKLITQGVMAININQKKGENYISWMIQDVSKFKGAKYMGVISYAHEDLKNPQPIWIWKKIDKKINNH